MFSFTSMSINLVLLQSLSAISRSLSFTCLFYFLMFLLYMGLIFLILCMSDNFGLDAGYCECSVVECRILLSFCKNC